MNRVGNTDTYFKKYTVYQRMDFMDNFSDFWLVLILLFTSYRVSHGGYIRKMEICVICPSSN